MFIGDDKKLFLVNVSNYNIIRKIEAPNSDSIYAINMQNKNMLLTASYIGEIR